MEDKELKDTLLSLCQILKDEIFCTSSVNAMMIALARAILAKNEPLGREYEAQWQKLSFGVLPPVPSQTSEIPQRLDALISEIEGVASFIPFSTAQSPFPS